MTPTDSGPQLTPPPEEGADERSAREFRGAGVRLTADVVGNPADVPILFLHGGGQTRASWGKALPAMTRRGLYAISLDLRGHGESEHAPDGDYRLERFAEDVRAVMGQLSQPPFLVGASLGGLASLLAVTGPHAATARGLVLVDIVPQMEQEGTDHVTAFMRSAPNGFASLEEAGAAVSAYLPHRPPPKSLEGLRRNLREAADGRLHWHWDKRFVDGPLTSAVGSSRSQLEDAARSLTIPTMLLRGTISKVVSLEGARAFLAITPHAEVVDITDADHMVAGDANDVFNDAVASFVQRNLANRQQLL